MYDEEPDEFTPRERGLRIGHLWAERTDATRVELEHVAARGELPGELREYVLAAGMRERLGACEDPNAEDEFWTGFADGVLAWLRESYTGAGPN